MREKARAVDLLDKLKIQTDLLYFNLKHGIEFNLPEHMKRINDIQTMLSEIIHRQLERQ